MKIRFDVAGAAPAARFGRAEPRELIALCRLSHGVRRDGAKPCGS